VLVTSSPPLPAVSRLGAFHSGPVIPTDPKTVFLIVSEFPLFRTYFVRNWPLLSLNSGFVTLGVAMIILGVSILGNLNKGATSEDSLGLAFWRIVISSGIVVIILGFLNIISVSPPQPLPPRITRSRRVHLNQLTPECPTELCLP